MTRCCQPTTLFACEYVSMYHHRLTANTERSRQMQAGKDEEEHTQEHLNEQAAVSIPGVLVPAVGQVVGHVRNDAWVPIIPAH